MTFRGCFKSGALAWLSGARERVGLGSREGSQWLMTRRLPRGGDAQRIGSEYRFLAESLGLPTEDFAMAVHYGEAEAAFVEEIIQREGLGSGYAVLCPFTTRPQKHWFEERWAELARRVRSELGLTPVLLGGPTDREAATRIADATDDLLVDVTGRTSLTEAAALIDRAALLVAVDTGLGHMGIALDTPSLLLFGSTCPYLDTTRANARVLYHPLPCSPCKRRPTCGGSFDCMRLIGVEEIMTNACRGASVMRILHVEGGRHLYGGAFQVLHLLRGTGRPWARESARLSARLRPGRGRRGRSPRCTRCRCTATRIR